MTKTQKFLIGLIVGALVVLLGWQYWQWQEQLDIHDTRVVALEQQKEQFDAAIEALPEDSDVTVAPMDLESRLAEEDARLAGQKELIKHHCILIVLLALLAAALVWRWPLLKAWGNGQTEAYYRKRGKESPAAKKARLKREKHNHPPKR